MKTEIRYSWVYSKTLSPELKIEEWREFVKKSEPFKKITEKLLPEIIKLIEKHHQKKWNYDFIPIYLIPNNKISFSDPLTLVYRFHEEFSIVSLIHELLHNNLTGKKFANSEETHKYMEPITEKIILDLEKESDLKLQEAMKIYNKKTMEIANKK